mmetsp:Transcript_5158/g.4357  ORF Transcript_5158/g.4357 Transcript_5158/m.4357 type:complete len:168 (+) Transcript_5158:983-1486(+)
MTQKTILETPVLEKRRTRISNSSNRLRRTSQDAKMKYYNTRRSIARTKLFDMNQIDPIYNHSNNPIPKTRVKTMNGWTNRDLKEKKTVDNTQLISNFLINTTKRSQNTRRSKLKAKGFRDINIKNDHKMPLLINGKSFMKGRISETQGYLKTPKIETKKKLPNFMRR